MARQPMWVTFCHLPEKGRREIEETVDRRDSRGAVKAGQGKKGK